jgi:hypothetical protein
MKIKSYIIFILLAFSLLTLGGLFVINNKIKIDEADSQDVIARRSDRGRTDAAIPDTEKIATLAPLARNDIPDTQSVLFDVPFTSQAPFGNWDNQVFQQACEEASMLMAMLWVEGKEFISKEDANKAILEISDFEEKNYGYFEDTSAEDTAIIMKDYFSYNNIEVLYDIGSQDIKRELANGSIVITPMNGQKVGNPFYTPPGPLRHMILVVGYDRETKEFITNDPGTRHGEGFRYKEDIFEAALQDYITGHKEPIDEIRSAIIVVRRISF